MQAAIGWLGLAWLLSMPGSARAGKGAIVFSVAPTRPHYIIRKDYQPLVDHLSRACGRKIVLEPARSFLEYANKIRSGKYHLLFDGPHFIGWRIEHLDHVVLVRLPGRITFVVVAPQDSLARKVTDLTGRRVCCPAPPHLATLALLDEFPNPAHQPVIVPVTSFTAGLTCLRDGEARAAVFRDRFWEKQVKDKTGLKVIHVIDKGLPECGFSISTEIDEETRRKIAEALTGNPAAETGQAFIPAGNEEYRGLGRLLKGVWGFHRP